MKELLKERLLIEPGKKRGPRAHRKKGECVSDEEYFNRLERRDNFKALNMLGMDVDANDFSYLE